MSNFFYCKLSKYLSFGGTAVNSVCHTTPNMQSNVITTGEKKKVFVTGSGNIEVTQVSPITHPPNVIPNITPNITSNVSNAYYYSITT